VTDPAVAGPAGPADNGTAEAGLDARPPEARTIDEILAAARARLHRLTPAEAFAEFARGAVLVDIRPQAQRAREGGIPGAVIVERNVLEWRFDPASDARLPWVRGYGEQLIVFCSEGYTSSLAAAALQDLGLAGATDIAGGFVAWAADGLPVCPPGAARTGSTAERAC
jgi:rhodanese-related sulfurtransferase